ncbi:MAG: DUF2807 domain-containing protein [Robiginitomaculum sp.]|nr:DUF2807 domain-containing protein [Robiginitomaculum sp.]
MTKFTYTLIATTCLAMLGATTSAKSAPVSTIENYIGTIDVVTGDYNKITVTDADGVPIDTRRSNVTVDGQYKINNAHCRSKRSSIKIGIGNWKYLKRTGGYKDLSEYPKIKIQAPKNTHIVIKKSVIFGDVEDIGSADIQMGSCGNLKFGDVNGNLDLGISGNADVEMGDIGPANISISGAGDFVAGDLASADIYVSGSGDLEVGDILAFANIHSSGAGDIKIARIKGGLEYRGSGASDFDADYVGGGDLYIRVSGSGDVNIDDGDIIALDIVASGASDVVFGGHSKSAKARASGASDVTIDRPSGDLHTSDSGAGDVHVK